MIHYTPPQDCRCMRSRTQSSGGSTLYSGLPPAPLPNALSIRGSILLQSLQLTSFRFFLHVCTHFPMHTSFPAYPSLRGIRISYQYDLKQQTSRRVRPHHHYDRHNMVPYPSFQTEKGPWILSSTDSVHYNNYNTHQVSVHMEWKKKEFGKATQQIVYANDMLREQRILKGKR